MPRFATIAARWLGVLCFAIIAIGVIGNAAFADPLDASGPPQFKILQDAEFVREDLTPLTIEEAIARYRAGDYALAKTSTGDPTRPNSLSSEGLIYGPVWARLEVTNRSKQPTIARLDSRLLYLGNVLTAYIVRDNGSVEPVWRNNWLDEPFAAQFPKMRLKASSTIMLVPGETIEIWIDYPYGFYLNEQLWLISEPGFVERRIGDAGYAAFLFGWRAALIVAVLAFAIILRSRVAAYYALFSSALFAFFLQNYGFSYFYFFRSFAIDQTFYMAMGALAFTFFGLMSREFLSAPKLYPNLNKALLWTLTSSWIVGGISLLLDRYIDSIIIIMPAVLAFIAVCIYAAILGVRNKHDGAILYLIATVMLFATNFFGFLGWPPLYLIPHNVIVDMTHLGFSIDALLFAGALAIQALALRQERDDAYEAKIASLSEQTTLTQRLDTMSSQHDRALALAETRRRALAETTHDLKQPLLSLQMSLRDKQDVEALSQGVSYLQSVVDKTLDDARPGGEDGVHQSYTVDRTTNLGDIIANISTMFADEAQNKGLKLIAVPSSVVVKAEPVILMRILINLVANAIKHTDAGRVLLGIRRRDGTIAVEVHDTGSGMTERDLQNVFEPYVSGAASSGEGLGLAIVKELAIESGIDIQAESQPGKGSVFRLVGLLRTRARKTE